MSPNSRKVVIAGLLLLSGGVVGVGLWTGKLSGSDTRLEVNVLCAKCGHYGQASMQSLSLSGGGARAPAYGRGAICPKCQKPSLYANPIICEKCKKPYFVTLNSQGAVQAKCPNCGTMP